MSLRLLRFVFPLTLLVSLNGCFSLLDAAVKESPPSTPLRPGEGPSNASVYSIYLRALEAERLGNLEEAEKLIRRAIDLDPNSATLTVQLAKIRAQQRQLPESIELTRRAIQLQPSHVEAQIQLATLLQLSNRPDDAEAAWKKVISLAPTHERAHIELANLYRTRDQAREGLALLEGYQKRGGEAGVQMLMLMAALHKDAGDLETAQKEVLEVLDQYPDFPQAQRALLDLYFAEGGLKDVAARLEKLFQERPWQTWIRDTLVQLYARLGDVDGINRQLLDATESDQEEGDRLRLEAVEELASRREFPKAVQVIEPMLKANTDNERAWFFAGYLYARQKDFNKALEFYGKIPKGSLLYPRALDQRARVLQAALRSDEAVVLLTSYLQEEPDADEIRSTLVTIYANTRNFKRALEGVEELLKRNPSDVDALSQRAFILHDMKRDDEALAGLRKAIVDQPGQVRLYEAQSLILGELGRPKEAVEVLKQALLVQPESESLRFALGTYYDQLKMHDEAIAEMFKILENNRNSSEAMNFIGYTWAELGIRLPEAETYIKRALELDPNNGYITDSLGWVYYKAGRYPDAVKLLERAVELTTQEPVIVDHLGDAYLKVGDKEKAFKMFERATREAEGDEKVEPELEATVRRKYEALGKELGRPIEPRKASE
ncbi:MAG: tetratricopeptide repeat protein [Myxococcota bacterium]